MIEELAKKLDFPDEAIACLCECYEKMTADQEIRACLDRAADQFFLTSDRSYEKELDEVARRSGICRYSVDMVFALMCARPLRYMYRVKNIPEQIYYDSLADLRAKLMECKRKYGVWGLFVLWWYPKTFYSCRCFALGRLEYERISFPLDDYKGILKKGDIAFSCHIPSSGALKYEDVIDSLRRAHAFFQEDLKDGILPVYCSSWMLYPPTAALYGQGSNLHRFYELFDVVNSTPDPNNGNFWRIFYQDYSPETIADAPEETSLQRKLKKYLMDGGTMGNGRAVLLFDGEKILDKP